MDRKVPLPASLEEAESLIQEFYSSNDTSRLAQIDKSLKKLQKSEDAFRWADDLLGSSDTNVRFIGALTFTVKINRDWNKLGESEAESLLYRLLDWLVKSVELQYGALVIRKLCSALVAIFIQSKAQWTTCVEHVLRCLCAKEAVGMEGQLANLPSYMQGLIEKLNPQQHVTLVWFASSLTEEIGKTSSQSASTHMFHEALTKNCSLMFRIINHGIVRKEALDQNINVNGIVDSVKLFQSLLSSAQIASFSAPLKQQLLDLITRVIELLENAELFDVATELLIDALETHNKLFTGEQFALIDEKIQGPESTRRLEELKSGSGSLDAIAMERLSLAFYGSLNSVLASNPNGSEQMVALTRVVDFMHRPGIAIKEDETIPEVLEFWSNLVEAVRDNAGNGFISEEGRRVFGLTLQAVTILLLQKVQKPSTTEWAAFDSNTKTEFNSFRRDFQDFLMGAYDIMGLRLFECLGLYTGQGHTALDWDAVETGLFSISGLAEMIAEDAEIDGPFFQFFETPLWAQIVKEDAPVPPLVRNAAVHLISCYSAVFRRQHSWLKGLVPFLFRCLQDSPVAATAAKTIADVCDACRGLFIGQAQAFVDQFISYVKLRKDDEDVLEKLMAGVAAVIESQAHCPTPELRQRALHALRSMISVVGTEMGLVFWSADAVGAKPRALETVRCLAAAGKAYRTPESGPVDLDAEEKEPDAPGKDLMDTVQHHVVQICFEVFRHFPHDGDLTEAVCKVVQAGMTETYGPFVLPPAQVEGLLGERLFGTPNPSAIFEIFTRVLRKHKARSNKAEVRQFAMRCLAHAKKAIVALDDDPTRDPEWAAAVLDFLQAYVPKFLNLLFYVFPPDGDALWILAQECLKSREIMPRRSAAALWSQLLSLQDHISDEALKVQQALAAHGLALLGALLRSVSGCVARSEVEHLVPPLKKLIVRWRDAPQWLRNTNMDQFLFNNERVTEQEKRMFAEQLIRLRGGTETNKVCREWWVKCRGTFAV